MMTRKVGIMQIPFISETIPLKEGASPPCLTCHLPGQEGSLARARMSSPMATLTQATTKKAKRHPANPAITRCPASQELVCAIRLEFVYTFGLMIPYHWRAEICHGRKSIKTHQVCKTRGTLHPIIRC